MLNSTHLTPEKFSFASADNWTKCCVRVLEIPTPRWSAYDAKYFDVEMPEGTSMQLQDRAYKSAVWYTP